MYDANAHYLLMARQRQRKRPEPQATLPNDSRASQRIMPGMAEKTETRMDRILKPYRGRSYEGPTEPEVV